MSIAVTETTVTIDVGSAAKCYSYVLLHLLCRYCRFAGVSLVTLEMFGLDQELSDSVHLSMASHECIVSKCFKCDVRIKIGFLSKCT